MPGQRQEAGRTVGATAPTGPVRGFLAAESRVHLLCACPSARSFWAGQLQPEHGFAGSGFAEKAWQCHQQTIRSIAVARRSRKASLVVTSCLIPMDVLIKV